MDVVGPNAIYEGRSNITADTSAHTSTHVTTPVRRRIAPQVSRDESCPDATPMWGGSGPFGDQLTKIPITLNAGTVAATRTFQDCNIGAAGEPVANPLAENVSRTPTTVTAAETTTARTSYDGSEEKTSDPRIDENLIVKPLYTELSGEDKGNKTDESSTNKVEDGGNGKENNPFKSPITFKDNGNKKRKKKTDGKKKNAQKKTTTKQPENGYSGKGVSVDEGWSAERCFAICANHYILWLCLEEGKSTKGSNAMPVSSKPWGANNPIPDKTILKMAYVPKEYKKSYKTKLNGYMCDRCGKKDLGIDTRAPNAFGAYLYWLETGNQPFDGAVCTACYVNCEKPKRERRKKTRVSV